MTSCGKQQQTTVDDSNKGVLIGVYVYLDWCVCLQVGLRLEHWAYMLSADSTWIATASMHFSACCLLQSLCGGGSLPTVLRRKPTHVLGKLHTLPQCTGSTALLLLLQRQPLCSQSSSLLLALCQTLAIVSKSPAHLLEQQQPLWHLNH